MKKMMVALAVAAFAVASEAATVAWNSGKLMAPDASGNQQGVEWNGSKYTFDASKYITDGAVKAYIWESASALTFAEGDLIKWYEGGMKGNPFAGSTALSPVTSASNSANGTGTTSFTSGTQAYGAVLYVYTDSDSKVWYMENMAEVTAGTSKKTVNLLANLQGGGAANKQGTLQTWTAAVATPEPTSAMLLLLGFAGLALRRRRA